MVDESEEAAVKQKKYKVMPVFGTRPEAIKMAPVVKALEEQEIIDCRVVVTAQHREMLDQVLELFGIEPDYDLDLMLPGQSLAGLTSRAMEGLSDIFSRNSRKWS
jgi:UDP-N-acetylglucosamine 2-epimerase (non-hydrolysing)